MGVNLTHPHPHHHRHMNNHTKALVKQHEQQKTLAMTDRLFLWHKDTDPYSGARMQSAAYYKDLKIITSSNRGCLDRLYDLKHDPYEKANLIERGAGGSCTFHFGTPSLPHLETALRGELIKKMCENKVKHNHHSIHPQQEGNHSKTSEYHSESHCISKYVHSLVERAVYMFTKLAPFAMYGSEPFHHFMREDIKRGNCSVPLLSQVHPIVFDDRCMPEH